MPRARNIKHGFFINDKLSENDPLGRLLFIGMWTLADYKGDLVWNSKKIKIQLLPYDDCDIEKLAINLDKSGFIMFYHYDGQNYVRILNFDKHQNPHPNEKRKGSDIPSPTEEMRQAVDLKGLTINRDKSRQVSEQSVSDNADSLSLIPDTGSPISPQKLPFTDFYQNYPVKKSRADAEKAWKKLKREDQEKAIEGIQGYLKANDAGFYVHPSTYLNGRRWEDEPSKINGSNQRLSVADHNRAAAQEAIQAIRQRRVGNE